MWDSPSVRVPLFCSTCGATARPAPVPGRAERFRAWFAYGDRHRGGRFECDNGHGWMLLTADLARGSRTRVSQLFRAIASSRTIMPTPRSYTVVAGIGLATGATWNLLLGWPWWLGPVGFVVAAWVGYLSTAMRGPQRVRTVRLVQDQLRPSGARTRHEEQLRRDIEQMSFAAVGLAEQVESPWLSGATHRGNQLTGITITYGDSRLDDSPFIWVTTTIDPELIEFVLHLEADWLRRQAAGPSHLSTSDPLMIAAEVSWLPTDAMIDNTSRTAWWAELGDNWSLVVEDGSDRTVVVAGLRGATLGSAVLESLDASECATEPGA